MAMKVDKVIIRKTEADLNQGEGENSLNPRQRKKRNGRRFKTYVRGSIPLGWVKKACSIGNGSVAKAAWALWYLCGVKGTYSLKFGNKDAREFGLTRHAKNRSLKMMENASLIRLNSLPGQLYTVEILIDKDEFSE